MRAAGRQGLGRDRVGAGGVRVLRVALLGGDDERLAGERGGLLDLPELDGGAAEVAGGDHHQRPGVAAAPGREGLLEDGHRLVQLVGGVQRDAQGHAGERPPPGVARRRQLDGPPARPHGGHLVARQEALDRPPGGDGGLDQERMGGVLDRAARLLRRVQPGRGGLHGAQVEHQEGLRVRRQAPVPTRTRSAGSRASHRWLVVVQPLRW